MKFLRVFPTLVLGVLAFVGGARIAQADPHAVFYTAVGQQQLFFNVLAALDQADYVEPADGGLSRNTLLQQRSETEFGPPSDDDRLTTTQTNLSSVLTRNITLEGYDLWTAYLVNQRANDFQRRIAIGELSRLWCQEALGIDDCDSKHVKNFKRDEAFITSYVDQEETVVEDGALAALLSGSQGDADRREELHSDIQSGEQVARPYEYDPSVAAAWKTVENDPDKLRLLSGIAASAFGASTKPAVDSAIYDNIAFENSRWQPSYELSSNGSTNSANAAAGDRLSGFDYVNAYASDLYRVARGYPSILGASKAAAKRVAKDQEADQDGFKATRDAAIAAGLGAPAAVTGGVEAGAGLGGLLGRIVTYVTTPSESRVADTHADKATAGLTDSTAINSAPARGQNEPGTTLLTVGDQPGNVQGVQNRSLTTHTASGNPGVPSSGQDERVAGFLDDLIGFFVEPILHSLGLFGLYDEPRPAKDLEANIAPAHDEDGIGTALNAFDPDFSEGAGSGTPSCDGTCLLNSALNAISN